MKFVLATVLALVLSSCTKSSDKTQEPAAVEKKIEVEVSLKKEETKQLENLKLRLIDISVSKTKEGKEVKSVLLNLDNGTKNQVMAVDAAATSTVWEGFDIAVLKAENGQADLKITK